jgi:tRNA pseudouridine38-40 synthase
VRTFRFVVGYDGTDCHGWQSQPGLRTVQGILEASLRALLADERLKLHGAGRTDAGVHARGQVCSFESTTRLPARAIQAGLARSLPGEIAVKALEEAPAGFHARHSALARRYAYRLLDADDPLLARFAWRPARGIDPVALEVATRPVEGEHDFASFQAAGSTPTHPVCRIHRARWARWEGGLRLDIVADRFLYRMVRNLVGTALALARTRDPEGAMRAVLAARDRRRAGATAPPQGLCLEEVFYPREGRA